MSEPDAVQPAGDKRPKRTGKEETRLAVAVVLGGLLTAFALLNLERVRVHYVFGTGHPRLIFVIVACVLLGAAIGWNMGRRRPARKVPKD